MAIMLFVALSCMARTAWAYDKSAIQQQIISILYGGSGGRMTCDFDGYTTTPGRHEGIDFAKAAGTSIRCVIDGTVTRVTNPSFTGSLSTCAIYDSANDMTVVYLHGRYSVAAGDSVTRGQVIGTEASYGAGSAHTHIEVRSGRRTAAAKSTNDSTLDNPDCIRQ